MYLRFFGGFFFNVPLFFQLGLLQKKVFERFAKMEEFYEKKKQHLKKSLRYEVSKLRDAQAASQTTISTLQTKLDESLGDLNDAKEKVDGVL